MGEPLVISTFAPRDHTASYYYRLLTPLKAMHDLGLPLRALVDTDSTNITQQERVEAFCEADICFLYQPASVGKLHNIKMVQTFIPSKRDGAWKWPPSIIIDSDDNLFHVSVLNPAYANLGTRDPEGNEIPAGNTIGVVQDGQRVIKWIDGHTCDGKCGPGGKGNCNKGINLTANREALNVYRQIINAADAFTCSTPPIASTIKKEAQPQRVKVFPNLVRFDDYEQVDLAPQKQIKILWQGGQNHYEDWYPLRKQLGRITKQYPQVHWVIWGPLYPWILEEIPADRYTYRNWCSYQEYKLRLAMVGHDINLAPLTPNPFNECRSAIKWYESSVLKRPAATLAQNTGAYAAEMQDSETGLLFSTPQEFEDKLGYLIELADERKRMADNAKQWLSENRDAMKKVPEMYAYWQQLRTERKREQPHPSEREWAEIEAQAEAEWKQQEEQARMNGQVAAGVPA